MQLNPITEHARSRASLYKYKSSLPNFYEASKGSATVIVSTKTGGNKAWYGWCSRASKSLGVSNGTVLGLFANKNGSRNPTVIYYDKLALKKLFSNFSFSSIKP